MKNSIKEKKHNYKWETKKPKIDTSIPKFGGDENVYFTTLKKRKNSSISLEFNAVLI